MQRPKDCRPHEGKNLCSDVPKLVPAGTWQFLNAYWLTENKNTKTKGKLGFQNKQKTQTNTWQSYKIITAFPEKRRDCFH